MSNNATKKECDVSMALTFPDTAKARTPELRRGQKNCRHEKDPTLDSLRLLEPPKPARLKPDACPKVSPRRRSHRAPRLKGARVQSVDQLCAKVKNKLLQELALRISFSPREKRVGQLRILLKQWSAACQGNGQKVGALASVLELPPDQKDSTAAAFSAQTLTANLPFIISFVAANAGLRCTEWPEPLQLKRRFLKTLDLRPGAVRRLKGLISLPLIGPNGRVQEFLPQSVINQFLANSRLFLAQNQADKEHPIKQAQIKIRAAGTPGASLYKPLTKVERALAPGALLRMLKKRDAEWVHSNLFNNRHADELILKAPEPPGRKQPQETGRSDPPPAEIVVGTGPLLTAQQEHDLFCRMNYLKCKTWRRIHEMEEASVTAGDLSEITGWIDEINELRVRLASANTRLVVKIVRSYFSHVPNWPELIGEGNLGLLRAMDKFDFATGNKFSTYASRCIIAACQRQLAKDRGHSSRSFTPPEGLLETIPDPWTEEQGESHDAPIVVQKLWEALETLSPAERRVLEGRYPQDGETRPATLQALGLEIGVSRERIRQIEQKALFKLRAALSPSLGETDALSCG